MEVKDHPAYKSARRVRRAVKALRPPRYSEDRPREDPSERHHGRTRGRRRSRRRYRIVGESAIENIEAALTAGGFTWREVGAFLDLGCGYGRVLRHVVRQIGSSRVLASDIDSEALAFCREEFGVRTIASNADLSGLDWGQHDVIWSGSLLTHLEERNFVTLVSEFPAMLKSRGIVVFTTHGQYCLEHLERYDRKGEYVRRGREIRDAVAAHGMFYMRYPGSDSGYGIAWMTEDFVTRTVHEVSNGGLARILFRPRGWDSHQDVFAFQRTT